MNTVLKYVAAVTVLGALAVALSLPSQAQTRRQAAAMIYNQYGPGAYAREYAYDYAPTMYPFPGAAVPDYAAASGFGAYAYSPGFYSDAGGLSCVTQGGYGKQFDYAGCY